MFSKENSFIYISVMNAQAVEQIYFQLSNLGFEFLQNFDISPLISGSCMFSGKIPGVLIQKHPKNTKYPVFLRHPSTDLAVYRQVYEKLSYDLELNVAPNIIVDAGANIGLASVYFANKYPNAKIISIEPEKNNFEILKKNISSYENIIPLNAALWNENKEICVIDVNDGSWGFQVGNNSDVPLQKINAFTVDKIMEMFNLPKIDLLKIDIECAEKEVFENPAAWISNVNAIAIELHERLKPGCNRSFYKGTDGYFSEEKSIGETVWVWR
jgi:FkbM family methyltransferase